LSIDQPTSFFGEWFRVEPLASELSTILSKKCLYQLPAICTPVVQEIHQDVCLIRRDMFRTAFSSVRAEIDEMYQIIGRMFGDLVFKPFHDRFPAFKNNVEYQPSATCELFIDDNTFSGEMEEKSKTGT